MISLEVAEALVSLSLASGSTEAAVCSVQQAMLVGTALLPDKDQFRGMLLEIRTRAAALQTGPLCDLLGGLLFNLSLSKSNRCAEQALKGISTAVRQLIAASSATSNVAWVAQLSGIIQQALECLGPARLPELLKTLLGQAGPHDAGICELAVKLLAQMDPAEIDREQVHALLWGAAVSSCQHPQTTATSAEGGTWASLVVPDHALKLLGAALTLAEHPYQRARTARLMAWGHIGRGCNDQALSYTKMAEAAEQPATTATCLLMIHLLLCTGDVPSACKYAVTACSVPGFTFQELLALCCKASELKHPAVAIAALSAYHAHRTGQAGAYDPGQPAQLFARLLLPGLEQCLGTGGAAADAVASVERDDTRAMPNEESPEADTEELVVLAERFAAASSHMAAVGSHAFFGSSPCEAGSFARQAYLAGRGALLVGCHSPAAQLLQATLAFSAVPGAAPHTVGLTREVLQVVRILAARSLIASAGGSAEAAEVGLAVGSLLEGCECSQASAGDGTLSASQGCCAQPGMVFDGRPALGIPAGVSELAAEEGLQVQQGEEEAKETGEELEEGKCPVQVKEAKDAGNNAPPVGQMPAGAGCGWRPGGGAEDLAAERHSRVTCEGAAGTTAWSLLQLCRTLIRLHVAVTPGSVSRLHHHRAVACRSTASARPTRVPAGVNEGREQQQQQQQQGNLLSQAAAELAMEAVCLVSKLMNSRKEGTSGPEGAQAAVRWVDIMPAVRQAVGQCFGDPALVGPLLACLARCVEQHMQMATSPETAQGATGPMPVARGNLRGLCEAADALEPPTPCKGPPAASLCVPLREDERQELAWLAAFAAEAVPAAIPGSEHHKDCEAGRADGGALPAAVFQKLLNMTT
eukprot:CAMPEP_0117667680 /NCGR_PEP_ID=MMETSP0804-20121206/11111_1 /TAXON_ID=1074897 /ORGANISM="Tetraselmis astigmatica, Strain CCMP880" /LENGTH=867 /DNA_ID=CAMNT_0005475453 /DNA_START=224 /DNA_END=2827 /DNA_ORIENTATION=+